MGIYGLQTGLNEARSQLSPTRSGVIGSQRLCLYLTVFVVTLRLDKHSNSGLALVISGAFMSNKIRPLDLVTKHHVRTPMTDMSPRFKTGSEVR